MTRLAYLLVVVAVLAGTANLASAANKRGTIGATTLRNAADVPDIVVGSPNGPGGHTKSLGLQSGVNNKVKSQSARLRSTR